jgi:peptide/nickel transport system ATP-binding protein
MNTASDPPLLALNDVTRRYRLPRESLLHASPVVQAVAGVSLQVQRGRSFGLVGESGSGKSTLARLVMALEPPTSGEVRFMGRDLNRLGKGELQAARRDFQMVFQDPYGSLDPRQRVGRIVAEPLSAAGSASPADVQRRVAEALDAVGLRASDAGKYPHEFSGGQRQRIAIARALITRPKLIVADEPVSALDVSVQAQVLNLLQDLHQQFGVTYLLISHDLAVVDHVCDEVAVLYAGRIVEQGPPELLFLAPAHPYTRALVEAIPSTEVAAQGSPSESSGSSSRVSPDGDTTAACSFAARCAHVQARCVGERPVLRVVASGHFAACHFAETLMKPESPAGEPR